MEAKRIGGKVTVRAKSQVTLPQQIVRRLNIETGDDLIVTLREGEPEVIELRRLRRSYAGAAAGAYGTPEDVRAYVQGERDAWDR